jgi:hypothetical protein
MERGAIQREEGSADYAKVGRKRKKLRKEKNPQITQISQIKEKKEIEG